MFLRTLLPASRCPGYPKMSSGLRVGVEEILGPGRVVGETGRLLEEVGRRRDVLQLPRWLAVAQRLEGGVDRVDGRIEGRVALQADAHIARREVVEIVQLLGGAAEKQRLLERGRDLVE